MHVGTQLPGDDARGLLTFARRFVSSHHDAEDVVQDVWLRYLSLRDNNVRSLSAWQRIASRHIAYRLREQAWSRSSRESQVARKDIAAPVVQELEASNELEKLKDLLHSLSERHRKVLHMHFFEELSVSQIAVLEQCTARTVRNRIERGLTILRQQLEGCNARRERGGGFLSLFWLPILRGMRKKHAMAILLGCALVLGLGLYRAFASPGESRLSLTRVSSDSVDVAKHLEPIEAYSQLARDREALRTQLTTIPASGKELPFVVQGYVTRQRREPLEATLWAVPLESSVPERVGVSNGDGWFRVELAEPSLIWAEHPGSSPSLRLEINRSAGLIVDHTFCLGVGGEVVGHVADHEGGPLTEAAVILRPVRDTGLISAYGTRIFGPRETSSALDVDGSFAVLRPRSPRVQLEVWSRGVQLHSERAGPALREKGDYLIRIPAQGRLLEASGGSFPKPYLVTVRIRPVFGPERCFELEAHEELSATEVVQQFGCKFLTRCPC